jgi:hypothetical protein
MVNSVQNVQAVQNVQSPSLVLPATRGRKQVGAGTIGTI